MWKCSRSVVGARRNGLGVCHWINLKYGVGARLYSDADVGISAYVCEGKKLKGNLKSISEDFIVQEIFPSGEVCEIKHMNNIYHIPSTQTKDYQHVHFNMLKNSRSTSEAIQMLSRTSGIPVEKFNVAGLKDRKGITIQKISCPLAFANRQKLYRALSHPKYDPNVILGDFELKPNRIYLGSLQKNRFNIVIRDVKNSVERIVAKLRDAEHKGCINYYFRQRFGTGNDSGHLIGLALIRRNFHEACHRIISSIEVRGEPTVEEARKAFQRKEWARAYDIFPKKMAIEKEVLYHISTNAGNVKEEDLFELAIAKLAKSRLLVNFNAVSSFMWNIVATKRIQEYGLEVVEGDLVTLNASTGEESEGSKGTVTSRNEVPEFHVVTREDIEANRFTVKDVLLVLPWFDFLEYIPETQVERRGEERRGEERRDREN